MNACYAPLPNEALLSIEGADALKFLQGQTSCDTRQLTANSALPGLFCTPQGRVICDFLLCEVGDGHYVLRMRSDILATSAAILQKYIVFAKAKLQMAQDNWQILACWGEAVAAALGQVFGQLPDKRWSSRRGPGYTIVQVDTEGRQFECYFDKTNCAALLAQLYRLLPQADAADWRYLQIGNGVARIEATTHTQFVPQVLNFDITGHISFKKGCYTGQEVIARMHYRGKTKRRMIRAELPSSATAASGDSLYGGAGDQAVGTVLNCAVAQSGTIQLLATTIVAARDDLHLQGPDGPVLTLRPLPYAIPEQQTD